MSILNWSCGIEVLKHNIMALGKVKSKDNLVDTFKKVVSREDYIW